MHKIKEFRKILIHFKLKFVRSQELQKFSGWLKLYIACQWKQQHPAWNSAETQMNSVVFPETVGDW